MSDRSSQYIFARMFQELGKGAKSTSAPVREFALKMAKAMWKATLEFDFSPSDMDIPETMQLLKLHKPGTEEKDYEDEKWGPQR